MRCLALATALERREPSERVLVGRGGGSDRDVAEIRSGLLVFG
jgi:hypothetical protein